VPRGDEKAFAEALEKLAADRQLQKDLGARGLQYVQQVHSRERLVEDIKDLYGELMNQEVTSEQRIKEQNVCEY
jgi:glycosyltransferase involved in cell wall biosynthesis